MVSKGCIFYTDNKIQEPIKSIVEEHVLKSGLPIFSCSLKPLNFGKNIVLNLEPSFLTYMTQIKTALENSTADYVFFCEHDVLLPASHFDFVPSCDSIFYYNSNVYRWLFGSDKAITYDRLISLSGLCVNRKLALDHYERRLAKAKTLGEQEKREPAWARAWGYEPGTKKKKRGGFSDDDFETFKSEHPIVDIRHHGTISKIKVTLDSFKHQPTGWVEIPIEKIPGWDIRKLFNDEIKQQQNRHQEDHLH